jgi:hypothetical protein
VNDAHGEDTCLDAFEEIIFQKVGNIFRMKGMQIQNIFDGKL